MSRKIVPTFKEQTKEVRNQRITPILNTPRVTRSFSKVRFFLSLLFLILAPFVFIYSVKFLNSYLYNRFRIELFSSEKILATVFGGDQINPIKRDRNNRTTILLIGVDRGEGRFVTFNTDTIMTLTYDHNTHTLYTISYPRDLFVKIPNTTRTYDKINAVYLYGERIKKDGIGYLTQVVEDISGLKIHYYVMIDFDGFKRLIDELGGITLYNPRAFVDYNYPNPKGGYMTVRFEEGELRLDGERALQYARSRKAQGPEGSDFARARRQQRVLQAVFERISQKIKQNPFFLNRLFSTLEHTFKYSAITWDEIAYAISLYEKRGTPTIYGIVLEPSVANSRLLKSYAIPLYIIIPRHGLNEWYFTRLFIRDFMLYPELITNLPTKLYTVRCSDYSTYKREKDQLAKRFFYIQVLSLNKTNLCENYSQNTLLYPQEFANQAQTMAKIVGYNPILAEDSFVTYPVFLIFNKSNLIKKPL